MPRPSDAYLPPPQRLGPPRLVTLMGVWSIIVAGLCLLGGPISVFTMAAIASVSTRTAAIMAQRFAPPTITSVPEVVDPGGFAAADRAAVIDGLSRSRPITPGQQLQLDELLAESGRALIATGSPVDPAIVTASVSSSGQLGTLGTAGGEAENPPSYFVLANGRLELTDTRAVFFPGDGQPAIRAVAYALPELSSDATGTPPPLLSDQAIRSTVRAIVRLNGAKPKAAQVQAISTLLRGSSQQVVAPTTDGTDPAEEVASATSDADGTLSVRTFHGGSICDLTVTPAGQVSASLIPATAPTSAPPAANMPLGFVVIAEGFEAAVAIYLLVIGILTVRRARGGRWMHWVYVGVKLPVVASAVVAAAFLGKAVSGGAASAWWTLPALVGVIYPAVLVFVLCSRPVRDYYGLAKLTSAGTRYAPW